jgi:cytosine/adenosine deaminase-related metal-dependent hydrolase
VPSPVNAHTHLGDAVSVREPPAGPVSELVAPPRGYKFQLLARASPGEKRSALRAALRRMAREGVAATFDFREEGLEGVRLLRSALRRSRVRGIIFGRPLRRPVEPEELDALLDETDGIGLSSARDEAEVDRRRVARACRARSKRYALHASEAVRERPETYLDPRPDLLVHLARATPDDLSAVRDARVAGAVCPRSNALFGRQPNLREMERIGIPTLLGTDNAMFHSPSVWAELQFAYTSSRLLGRPVSALFLARAVLVEPWLWLGERDAARVAPESPVPPLVLRRPPDDPAYQIVTRTTEQFIVCTGPRAAKPDR